MLNKLYALELGKEGFTFLLVSPGVSQDKAWCHRMHVSKLTQSISQWLKTDMGNAVVEAELDVSVGVAALKKIILEADTSMNGKFVNIKVSGSAWYDGSEIPW